MQHLLLLLLLLLLLQFTHCLKTAQKKDGLMFFSTVLILLINLVLLVNLLHLYLLSSISFISFLFQLFREGIMVNELGTYLCHSVF